MGAFYSLWLAPITNFLRVGSIILAIHFIVNLWFELEGRQKMYWIQALAPFSSMGWTNLADPFLSLSCLCKAVRAALVNLSLAAVNLSLPQKALH